MPIKRPSPGVTRCVPASLRQTAPEGLSQRCIETDFTGGVITSNGGVTLLGRADEELDLTRRVAACFADYRRPELVVHAVETLVLQRLYGLALGYEDLNDHEDLRRDPALQAVAGRMTPRRGDCAPLAGKSTLNRLELGAAGRCDPKARKIVVDTRRLDALLVALCVESFTSEPEEVVLDLDATDIPLHGTQEERFFHGYYREYCYMPLLVPAQPTAGPGADAERGTRCGRRRGRGSGLAAGQVAGGVAYDPDHPAHRLGVLSGADPGRL